MRLPLMSRRGIFGKALRVSRRQDATPQSPPPEVESESEDEGDEPETPSPLQTAFPTSIPPDYVAPTTVPTSIDSATPAPTQSSTVDLGSIGTETLGVSSTTSAPTTTPTVLPATAPTSAQSDQAQQSDLPQPTEEPGIMNRGGVIAMGVLIGLAAVTTIAWVIWKCRRRRNESKRTSKFKPFFLKQGTKGDRSSQRRSRGAAGMDDLMAAAYAAENGNAGGNRPGSQGSDTLWREKQAYGAYYAPQQQQQQQQQQKHNPTSGSLYAKQLLTGFWKRGGGNNGDGMPAPPGQAHVPPPAPSVSGATESTWNTWGVTQHHHQPNSNWREKFRARGVM
ncbi:hypothetical protein SLS62_005368 [Diatrype stigma]|uniref:Uncharacterized protein n=1 Tax=Diatrype stigma TaxID=117547 RepID=A0AAN9YSJ0_9PEZI